MSKILALLKKQVQRLRVEQRKSLTVSIGLFFVALIVLYIIISRLVTSAVQSKAAEAALLKTKLEYRYSLLMNKDRLDEERTILENNWAYMKNRLYSEGSSDLALSTLQRTLDEMAKAQKLAIASYKFGEVKTSEGFSLLPLSLEFSGKYEEFVSLVYGLETNSKYLKITDLEVISLPRDVNIQVRMTLMGCRYNEKENQ